MAWIDKASKKTNKFVIMVKSGIQDQLQKVFYDISQSPDILFMSKVSYSFVANKCCFSIRNCFHQELADARIVFPIREIYEGHSMYMGHSMK